MEFNAQWLRAEREKLKLSQTAMAGKLGVHYTTYLIWERGGGQPNEENMKKIREYFTKENRRAGEGAGRVK